MLIVTPNPAVDHTIRLAELRPGEVIRTGPGVSVAGGKGANVARAARCLGAAATVLALLPEVGGSRLRSLFDAESLVLQAIPVAGRVRTCTAMIEGDGRVTLLNEPGAQVTAADWAALVESMTSVLGDADATGGGTPGPVVCSGSLPPGAPADGYALLVAAAHGCGRQVVVDASGSVLAAAIDAGADLVCPNVSEAELLLGIGDGAEAVDDGAANVPARAQAAAALLVGRGARWAVVTAGAAGAAVAGPNGSAWLAAPTVTVRNPIGAGDSFLAGLAVARQAGADWPTAIRRGLATGSASVEQEGAGMVDPVRAEELFALL